MINSQRNLSKDEAKAEGSMRNGEKWISEDWISAPIDSYTWSQLVLGCLVTWNSRFLFFFFFGFKPLCWGSLSQAPKQVVFQPPTYFTMWEWAVSLGHLLSRRWSPQSLCRAITLCGNIFPCFRFHVSTGAPFFLLKHVRGDTSPMYYGICPLCGRGLSPVTATQEGFMQDN